MGRAVGSYYALRIANGYALKRWASSPALAGSKASYKEPILRVFNSVYPQSTQPLLRQGNLFSTISVSVHLDPAVRDNLVILTGRHRPKGSVNMKILDTRRI